MIKKNKGILSVLTYMLIDKEIKSKIDEETKDKIINFLKEEEIKPLKIEIDTTESKDNDFTFINRCGMELEKPKINIGSGAGLI